MQKIDLTLIPFSLVFVQLTIKCVVAAEEGESGSLSTFTPREQ